MRTKQFAFIVVSLFFVTSMSQVAIATEDIDQIGTFDRLGGQEKLTTEDAVRSGDTLTIQAPLMASNLRIETSYLTEELGAWATDTTFSLSGEDHIVVDGEDTTFRPFVLAEEMVFTMGSRESVLFADRPMWISISPYGDGYKLEMDDGDTSGQTVQLNKEWLWSLGIHRPLLVHEDGSELKTTPTIDDSAYSFDMPHFSWVLLTGSEIDVKGRVAGEFVPHTAEKRWDSGLKKLEVDVDPQSTDYELWIEAEFINSTIPDPSLLSKGWTFGNAGGGTYYVITYSPSMSIRTAVFLPFDTESGIQFSFGSKNSVHTATPVIWEFLEFASGLIRFDVSTSATVENQLALQPLWLRDYQIYFPNITDENEQSYAVIQNSTTDDLVTNFTGSKTFMVKHIMAAFPIMESREDPGVSAYFDSVNQTWNLIVRAYEPWLPGNLTIELVDVPWGEDLWGTGEGVENLTIKLGGEAVYTRLFECVGCPEGPNPKNIITSVETNAMATLAIVLSPQPGGSSPVEQTLDHISSTKVGAGLYHLNGYPECTSQNEGATANRAEWLEYERGQKTSNDYTSNKDQLAAGAWVREWQYWWACGYASGAREAESKFGYGLNGRNLITGHSYESWGIGFQTDGTDWSGARNNFGTRPRATVWMIHPSLVMLNPMEGAVVLADFYGTSDKGKGFRCTNDTPEDVIKGAIGLISTFTSIAMTIASVSEVPEDACRLTIEERRITLTDQPGGGGKLIDSSTGDLATGGLLTWDFEKSETLVDGDIRFRWEIEPAVYERAVFNSGCEKCSSDASRQHWLYWSGQQVPFLLRS